MQHLEGNDEKNDEGPLVAVPFSKERHPAWEPGYKTFFRFKA
jgi:hypothetical protein